MTGIFDLSFTSECREFTEYSFMKDGRLEKVKEDGRAGVANGRTGAGERGKVGLGKVE